MGDFFDKSGRFISKKSGSRHRQMPDGFFQPVIVYNAEVKIGLRKKEHIPITFNSATVFFTKEDAARFLPTYLRSLISDGALPAEVLKDGKIDDSVLKTMVLKLTIGLMEKEVED